MPSHAAMRSEYVGSDAIILIPLSARADWAQGLQVIDIKTPASPVIGGGAETLSFARCVAVAGAGVCVADMWGGLLIAPRQCGDEGDI